PAPGAGRGVFDWSTSAYADKDVNKYGNCSPCWAESAGRFGGRGWGVPQVWLAVQAGAGSFTVKCAVYLFVHLLSENLMQPEVETLSGLERRVDLTVSVADV